MAHFGSIFFANMGGGGCQNCSHFGPDILGGVGVFHVSQNVLRNPGKPNFVAGYPGIFA